MTRCVLSFEVCCLMFCMFYVPPTIFDSSNLVEPPPRLNTGHFRGLVSLVGYRSETFFVIVFQMVQSHRSVEEVGRNHKINYKEIRPCVHV